MNVINTDPHTHTPPTPGLTDRAAWHVRRAGQPDLTNNPSARRSAGLPLRRPQHAVRHASYGNSAGADVPARPYVSLPLRPYTCHDLQQAGTRASAASSSPTQGPRAPSTDQDEVGVGVGVTDAAVVGLGVVIIAAVVGAGVVVAAAVLVGLGVVVIAAVLVGLSVVVIAAVVVGLGVVVMAAVVVGLGVVVMAAVLVGLGMVVIPAARIRLVKDRKHDGRTQLAPQCDSIERRTLIISTEPLQFA